MTISHELKIIFIHIQRTGGSSIINMLKGRLGKKLIIVSQHGNAQSEEATLLKDYPDYTVFTFVRNPWDRILSWYQLINKHNILSIEEDRSAFENFLLMDHAANPDDNYFHYNQLEYLISPYRDIKDINIYRFENFSNEVQRLWSYLNIIPGASTKTNGTIPVDYRNFYTEKSKALIREKCALDINHFDYSF